MEHENVYYTSKLIHTIKKAQVIRRCKVFIIFSSTWDRTTIFMKV